MNNHEILVAMPDLTMAMLLVVGVIHFLPLSGVMGVERLAVL
jgi:hypothetical protein